MRMEQAHFIFSKEKCHTRLGKRFASKVINYFFPSSLDYLNPDGFCNADFGIIVVNANSFLCFGSEIFNVFDL